MHFPKLKSMRIVFTGCCLGAGIFAQHRGDALEFQGLSDPNENSAKALAMGGAYSASSGELNSLFYNPAGLANITRFQIAISGSTTQNTWRENQAYRPNRLYMTMPFYLEGLYIPDPANNGQWDVDLFNRDRDSTYVFTQPQLGKDPFGKEAADWNRSKNDFDFNHLSAAIPLKLMGKSFVLSGSFARRFTVRDFDRNDTYLDPHIGYDDYGIAMRTANDTLRMNWFRYQRERNGQINSCSVALGFTLLPSILVGFGFQSDVGKTEDHLALDKVGWFDMTKNNRFRFSYDTLQSNESGTSRFSSSRFNLGMVFSFSQFSFGFNVTAPHAWTRKWETTYSSTGGRLQPIPPEKAPISSEDKMEIPLGYTIGIKLNPAKRFSLAMDVENIPYSKAKFRWGDSNVASQRTWVDRQSVRFGAEYRPAGWISILAGYRTLPETFVPDGAALKDRGPSATSFTFGFSLNVPYGALDAAYEIRQLKYYDSYYSNTNYVFVSVHKLLAGYTVQF